MIAVAAFVVAGESPLCPRNPLHYDQTNLFDEILAMHGNLNVNNGDEEEEEGCYHALEIEKLTTT